MEFEFMQPTAGESKKPTEVVPLNIIRVETALSRYPVHRLAKQGTATIEIREQSPDGEVRIQWKVSHNSGFGQPGPLAYRIDTLVVNRRIEEASRPVPRIIKLGSQAAIAEELGISTHDTASTIKRALYQNASAFITAKLRYKLADGRLKELEAGFSRYSVVFTGEELPDGRRADAVYLVLNEVFMQVINGAQTRPLDYDYLKGLTPASQRLYELLSFQMYASLKHARRDARLSYGEFCTYAPLTRFAKWDQIRPQMARIHRPHLKSGYIEGVEFQQSADRDGKPDWLMVYRPGPRARAEYRAFTKRGGPRVLEVEGPQAEPGPPPGPEAEPSPLEQELQARGVTLATAGDLVASYPEERIRRQLEQFDWLKEHLPKKVSDSPGGYLARAIRDDFAPHAKFASKADQERRAAAKQEERRLAAEVRRRQQAEEEREREAHTRVLQHWKSLTVEEQGRLDAEAEARADPETIAEYRDLAAGRNPMRDTYFRAHVRWPHIRRLLGLPQAEA